MLQADVFLAYGTGAGCALATAEQVRLVRADAPRLRAVRDRNLATTLLFMGLLFTPMGMWLSTRFPGWESMQVWRAIPPWALAAFGAGDTLCAAAGCLVTHRLLVRGRVWKASLQLLGAYIALFFTLVHGWDGTGVHRFLATSPGFVASGAPGQEEIVRWLRSPIAATLFWMTAVFLPALAVVISRSYTPGVRASRAPSASARLPGLRAFACAAALILGPCLALAVMGSMAVTTLGVPAGGVAWAVVAAFLLRPGGTLARTSRRLALPSVYSQGAVHALAPSLPDLPGSARHDADRGAEGRHGLRRGP
ncbi:hypothetical protein [Streptomyces griseocarneus]|uniref:hypothetical protein n=1 Tax=Streptomyces griseocarneus TaxID=51201 RepID=UPI00167C6340|nr:hypothetical protein [Streptomyces griseocarneus]MBZ6475910.1 hypothetical protein [Streptomyces griseocarneus]GHG50069.1 hypothetical protein GCM10018779_09820 [Streptomyces griseocarneus]